MPYNRRLFLQLALRSGAVLTAGNLLQSFAPAEFVFPDSKDIRLRFAVASDGHYGEEKTTYDLFFDELTSSLNLEKEKRGLDFSFINGDLIHNEPSFIPRVKDHLDKLSMPWHVSHGNHDRISEAEWKSTFGSEWHYIFEQNDIPFIVLNTADEKGVYGSPDMNWAAEKLKEYEGAKALFVFMHITPIDWEGPGDKECQQLMKLFAAQSNLKMIFHGHDHRLDSISQQDGKAYCFDAHIGGSWGTPYRGYRIVEVLHSGDIVTYQMNPAKKKIINKDRI